MMCGAQNRVITTPPHLKWSRDWLILPRRKRPVLTWKVTSARQLSMTRSYTKLKRSTQRAHSGSTVRRIMRPQLSTQRQSRSTSVSNASWLQKTYTTLTKNTRTSLRNLSKSRRTLPKQSLKTSQTFQSSASGKRASETRLSRSKMSTSNGLRTSPTSLSKVWTRLSKVANLSALSVRTRSKNCA